MALLEYYPVIKASHVGLVMLSGSVFMMRGLGVVMGSTMPLWRPFRLGSIVIDTALLLAALMLLWCLQLNPFTTAWLQAKLTLLLGYIGFGVACLRISTSAHGRLLSYGAALICYVLMFSIARSHDPAGLLRPLL